MKHHGDQHFIQTTGDDAASGNKAMMGAEYQGERPVVRTDLFAAIQGSIRRLAQRHLVRLNDLEALINVAFEVMKRMAAHTLKRCLTWGNPFWL
jgi:hypothetical protein